MLTIPPSVPAGGEKVQEIELQLNNDLHEIPNRCDENLMVVNDE